MGAVLGFDYGVRKIGVAVGQTVTRTATPLQTLPTRDHKPDWDAIARLIAEWQPEALALVPAVIGVAVIAQFLGDGSLGIDEWLFRHSMDDTEAPVAARARRFARQLEGRYRLPVHLADERLTTREAISQLGRDARRNALRVDAVAASLILETWLSDRN